MFATDTSIAVPDLAVAAEERDLHSIYLPEHTHIPTSRLTPAPTGTAELAEEYRRTMDPLIALAAAAASTEKIRDLSPTHNNHYHQICFRAIFCQTFSLQFFAFVL